MRTLLLAGLVAVMAGTVAAQTPDDTSVATRTGHEIRVTVGHYTYIEPGELRISIHGARFGGEYTGTRSLSARRHWFASANVRGNGGSLTYDGWCLPWRIRPSSTSANGYALDLGSASTCSETGEADGYVEARGLVGKDLLPQKWGVSPETGLGFRYLSNATSGIVGFRTDAYLYLPLGLTARTRVAHRVMSLGAEYDVLLHGWQTTRESKFGSGDIPATPDAPAFTLNGLTDLSFPQDHGWALRARGNYQVSRRWSVEPAFIHWNVHASPVRETTATFTVNGVTAQEPLGAFEPDNVTNEVSVSVGYHF
jgi:hypothetical protein